MKEHNVASTIDRRWAASVLILLSNIGCFGPSPAEGLTCSETSRCPPGQACVSGVCGASSLQPSATLKASNPEPFDLFGAKMAVDGDVLAVSSPGEASDGSQADDHSVTGSGAVYIFRRVNGQWIEEAFLKASNPDSGDGFGQSLAIAGDIVVVGAPGEDSSSMTINGEQSNNKAPDSGAVYAFRFVDGSWQQEAYIKAFNAQSGDQFGSSLSVSGDTLLVGAPNEDGDAVAVTQLAEEVLETPTNDDLPDSGAAYVYRHQTSGWISQAYLKASNPGAGDHFGAQSVLLGDIAVISAPNEQSSEAGQSKLGATLDNNEFADAGAAYGFRYDTSSWQFAAYLKANPPSEGDRFGADLATDGNLIAVASTSSTFVFSAADDAWPLDSQLAAVSAGGSLAASLAIADNFLLVGSVGDENTPGTARLFGHNNGWSEVASIRLPEGAESERFGNEVALSMGDLLVAAIEEDDDSGVVYFFNR